MLAKRFKGFSFGLTMLILTQIPHLSYAAQADEFIINLSESAIAALTDQSINEATQQERFRSYLQESFDMASIAKSVMGRYWAQATPEQKQEFQNLFMDHVTQQYARWFRKYKGQTVKVSGSSKKEGHIVVVPTVVAEQGGKNVGVSWKLVERGASFKVLDLSIEGVSLALTQREEIGAVIGQNGGDINKFLNDFRLKIGQTSSRGS